ncbi:unnamed protein product [Rotaria socialis]|uniref:Uncharacterized protein n=1 Tax=Rotaria socialis TaxID=392032 RepID=A0A817QM57_9BILA|nr:unnamed protein product [Rotaria socialis]CAF4252172.1 unnamed protein product [Rotaria socialis]
MINYLLFILLVIVYLYAEVHAGSGAVCFLTTRPALETLDFAQELAQDATEYGVDVFIMIDDNNFNISNIKTSTNLRLLQISNQQCIYYGYQNAISLKSGWREVTSWDKALLYFSLLNSNYTFVWLVEHDVFIPSTKAFLTLHQLYSNTSDLIVARNEINLLGDASTWLWSKAIGKLVPPWYCSMVNVVGLSRSMLIAIDDHVHWLGVVPFHEFFFNTLAMHLNMTIVTPIELNTINFQVDYSFEQVLKQSNNLWHPLKSLTEQKSWRQTLLNQSLEKNTTNEFIDFETLFHHNQTMINIENYLTNLLTKFEINKSQFSSASRISLRQRFCDIAKEYQQRNVSKNVTSIIMKLADHAYKLPELRMDNFVTSKSKNHLRLEQALKENRKTIFRSLSNSFTMAELRNETNNLMTELRSEIQREFKQQQERQNHTASPSSSSSSFSSSAWSFIITSSGALSSTRIISSTELTKLKINRTFYMLKKKNTNQIFDPIDDNSKIFFVILFSFCILFVLFKWEKIQT